MGLLDPRLPAFDIVAWRTLPYHERLRQQCGAWTTQGFGAPTVVYIFYLVKAALFVLGWALFASSTDGFGGLADIGDWWNQPIAFQKAVVWALLFEGLGFGCGSGPLTGRYMPPFVAFTHFLRLGTTRLPPWPKRNPFARGNRRTGLDVVLYGATIVAAVRVLLADVLITDELLLPLVVFIVLLGLRDKTVFLIFRSEHYLLLVIVFIVGEGYGEIFAAAKVVQLAIWWGAATSKLNRHFPAVVAVMVSNAPLIPAAIKRRAFVGAPDNMRPSSLSGALAHGGTVIEFVFPLVLILSTGGTATTIALAVMLAFHLFIMSAFALGVPTEWNIFVLYSMFFLFGDAAALSLGRIEDPVLIAVMVVSLLVVPVVGNLRPDLVSFLPSMRYYAGNWPTSQWLFRGDAVRKLDEHLVKTSKTVHQQLAYFYDTDTVQYVFGKVPTFRAMHLHGRLFASLLPRAVDDIEAFDVYDGELVAGLALGWNFGDGHLHNEELLAAIQEQCHFEPGELRCVMVEGQPMGKPWWQWRIVDAATGEVERGRANVADFTDQQPWDVQSDTAVLGVGR